MTHPALARRTSSRGLTLVELSATAAMLALVVSGFSWLVGGNGGGDQAELQTDADRILAAAELWQEDHSAGCPSLSELKRDRLLDEDARTEDPWGSRLRLLCTDGQFEVTSAGPDGELGTDDDPSIGLPRS